MRATSHAALKTAFGRKIKRLRIAANMSQEDLAYEAEIRRALVSEIEGGKANPTLETIARLAVSFGVDVADLFEPFE